MGTVSLYRYISLVKNLRGVLYWRLENPGKIEWLVSRFKYRNLGVPPSLAPHLPLKRKVLVPLSFPSEIVQRVVQLFSEVLDVRSSEALCLASSYVCPLMVLSGFEDFSDAVVDVVRTEKELSIKDWKLHMRIADYTVLDFYSWAVESALKALRGGDVEAVLEERKERIKKDKKRYWRLASEEGDVFLAYLDPLLLAYRHGLLGRLEEIGEDAAVTLGMISALVIR